ncbi:MAG TPA: 30S ribosomal protein S20 [Nitrospirae bacterium]|nr:30S ribosomal protein S20 [bacterium BMS3Abin10]GBE39682.1 30S ribosomal protein S20 [bacterium BMS3Bbin08]HDH50703.1 30S ribosomal protein S20 [Nitrospirota bacterium]HDK16649.1 30S ribosomal protein S20 [Nitrospirota bacterium]HDZ84465.1 30S ribosomal protein S20 [Nitrospirota bacterium]
MPAKAPPQKSKSAKKRVRQSRKLTPRNRAVKNILKTLGKKVEQAVESKNIDGAKTALNKFVSAVDKAEVKGVIHRNTASRKISQFVRRVNSLSRSGAA